MLDAVGLSDRLQHFPDELSGGQRQRVAIARALAPEPDLVLADEPTASLDSKSGQDVVELLGDLCRRRSSAVLLVTHDLRLLKDADRIWGIEDGRIHPWEEEEAKHNLSH
jgi:putative ABC transport system ATP-binding protein